MCGTKLYSTVRRVITLPVPYELTELERPPKSMESARSDSIFDAVAGWWQSIVQSVLALLFASSVTFDATGRTVYYTGSDAPVGEGAYSVVLKASGAFENRPQYALKKMLIQSEEADRMVRNEIGALARFRHPHIIGLLDHTFVNESGVRVAYLLFPLVGNGSLNPSAVEVRERTVRRLTDVLQGFLAVCEATNVLHVYEPSYVHQDIKLEVLYSFVRTFTTTNSYYECSWHEQNVLTGCNNGPYLIDLGSVRLAEVRIETRKDVRTSTIFPQF